jgi:hypothetical protein
MSGWVRCVCLVLRACAQARACEGLRVLCARKCATSVRVCLCARACVRIHACAGRRGIARPMGRLARGMSPPRRRRRSRCERPPRLFSFVVRTAPGTQPLRLPRDSRRTCDRLAGTQLRAVQESRTRVGYSEYSTVRVGCSEYSTVRVGYSEYHARVGYSEYRARVGYSELLRARRVLGVPYAAVRADGAGAAKGYPLRLRVRPAPLRYALTPEPLVSWR